MVPIDGDRADGMVSSMLLLSFPSTPVNPLAHPAQQHDPVQERLQYLWYIFLVSSTTFSEKTSVVGWPKCETRGHILEGHRECPGPELGSHDDESESPVGVVQRVGIMVKRREVCHGTSAKTIPLPREPVESWANHNTRK